SPDVVGDVGDGDDQAPARALAGSCAQLHPFAIQGGIELPGILAVDGDQRYVAQVEAFDEVAVANLGRKAFGLRQRLGGKLVRDVELADRHFDFHARVVDFAQDLHHAAQRLRVAGRLFDDFHG